MLTGYVPPRTGTTSASSSSPSTSRNRKYPKPFAPFAPLLLSQADHPPQVILVTSALPRESKTTAVANLAVTLAQLGDRTLLIDTDLRKPVLIDTPRSIGEVVNVGNTEENFYRSP